MLLHCLAAIFTDTQSKFQELEDVRRLYREQHMDARKYDIYFASYLTSFMIIDM